MQISNVKLYNYLKWKLFSKKDLNAKNSGEIKMELDKFSISDISDFNSKKSPKSRIYNFVNLIL